MSNEPETPEPPEIPVKLPAAVRKKIREQEKNLEFCKKIWGKDIKKRRK